MPTMQIIPAAFLLLPISLLFSPVVMTQEYQTSEQLIEHLSPTHPAPRTRGMIKTPGAGMANTTPNPSVLLNIQFLLNSSELTPQAMQQLNEVGKALSSAELGGSSFEVGGYTDASGDARYNRLLAEHRANAVKHYLSRNFGVNPERLNAVGWGEDKLLLPGNPYHPDNRRVEIVNLRR